MHPRYLIYTGDSMHPGYLMQHPGDLMHRGVLMQLLHPGYLTNPGYLMNLGYLPHRG